MNQPVVLPAGGEWTLKQWFAHGSYFLIAVNPEHSPMVIGRHVTGDVFIRPLRPEEKDAVS